MVKDVEAAGFKTSRLPTHPPTNIQFHNNNPDVPWYKRDVRLAIAMAIDGDAIVKNLFQGIPGRFTRLSPGELGYDPNLKQYPYDPKKAKELLAKAGYPNGFEMPLYYFTGRIAGQKETAEAVVLYLNAIGVRAKPQGIDAPQMLEKVRASGMTIQRRSMSVWRPHRWPICLSLRKLWLQRSIRKIEWQCIGIPNWIP
jgi:ABC-type transport system substrate-binding protein